MDTNRRHLSWSLGLWSDATRLVVYSNRALACDEMVAPRFCAIRKEHSLETRRKIGVGRRNARRAGRAKQVGSAGGGTRVLVWQNPVEAAELVKSR